MKISNNTINVLKSFSKISENILITPGNVLRTRSESQNVFARVVVEEEFEKEVSIYSLSRFLSSISLLDDPDYQFEDDRVIISSKITNLIYKYAHKSMIIFPKNDSVKLPSIDSTFEFDYEDIKKVMQASAVLGKQFVRFLGNEEGIFITTYDDRTEDTDVYSIQISENAGHDFAYIFPITMFNILPLNYTVELFKAQAMHLNNGNIDYWLAPSSISKFNK